jgi:hypothetical protein
MEEKYGMTPNWKICKLAKGVSIFGLPESGITRHEKTDLAAPNLPSSY